MTAPARTARGADERWPWRIGLAGMAGTVAGLALLAMGLVFGRPDVSAIGGAISLSMLWAWLSRPEQEQNLAVAPAAHFGETGQVAADLVLPSLGPASVAQVRVSANGYQTSRALIDARTARRVRLAVETARTGPHEVFRVDTVLTSADSIMQTDLHTVPAEKLLVLPGSRPLSRLPLPFRLQGLTGSHPSRRPGEGGDFRDVNAFVAGDRLRRIDWKVTARQAGRQGGTITELFVRRDFAMADATVMLIVDSRDEVGPDVSAWGGWLELRPDEPTSLDLAREAAASLAKEYLARGDRIGLDDLGRQSRPVAPAGGNAQLRRLVHRLAVLAPEGSPRPFKRAPQVPSGSLVVVFSTFLDEEAAALAVQWRGSGHRVIAVDVLPTLVLHHMAPAAQTAYRIIAMEREDRMLDLAASGVDVVHWRQTDRTPGGRVTVNPAAVELAALARRSHHR